MADYKITRTELLSVKGKTRLASKGHDLLKKKRDALIAELLKILKETADLRERLDKASSGAVEKMALAQAIDGPEVVESVALAVDSGLDVSVGSKNVMGVVVPVVEWKGDIKREYGLIGTSVRIDEASEAYSGAVKTAVELAKYEIAIKKLLDEVEKTKRRVNALEYIVLPRLKGAASYIRMRLDEIERDDFFRLKIVKRKIQRQE